MDDTAVQVEQRITWEEVYRAEGPRMWRSLLVLTGDPEAASDAMAEAFAQGIARGVSIRNPAAWAWKAAFMIARGDLTDRPASNPQPEEVIGGVNDEDVMDLFVALRRLSPLQRAAVVLHHYAGYPVKDVAQMLETSRSAIGVHLFRGRNRLRRELGGDDHA
jgi:RNA polymerase sigma-70 factor, ECF subfamily